MLAVLDARIAAHMEVGMNETYWIKEILEAIVRAEAAIGEAFGALSAKAKLWLHNSKQDEEFNAHDRMASRSVGAASVNAVGNGHAGVGASASAGAAPLSLIEEAHHWAERGRVDAE